MFQPHPNHRDPDSVDFVGPEVHAAWRSWRLVSDLLAGTEAMRDAAERWLPKEEGEYRSQYAARLLRSYLFPAYRDQISRLVAKPFSRSVDLLGSAPTKIEFLEDDTDGSGKSLTATLSDFAFDAIAFGLSHLLIDFPSQTGETLEDGQGARPIWRHVKAADVLGWRTVDEGGREVLDEIRFRDDREEPIGLYGTEVVPYVVHMTRDFVQRFRWDGSVGKWVAATDAKEYSFRHGIPLITAYTEQTGLLAARPPLMGLADLNLAHWQSTSDQRNIVHHVRVPVLTATGLNDKDRRQQIHLAAGRVIKFTSPEAKLAYTEHSGRAVQVGREDIERLEDQMEVLGLQPNVRKTVQATATAQRVKEGRTTTQMQEWLRRFEAAARLAFEYSATWLGEELPEDFEVDIFSDFGIEPGDATRLEALLKMRLEGEIPRRLFLEELKRFEVGEKWTVDEIVDELDEEHRKELAELPRMVPAPAGDGEFGAEPEPATSEVA